MEDARQAKLLTGSKSFNYFSPFLARDCTISEAAEEVGCSLEVMLYHVKQLQQAGLLKIVREETRAGKAIKVYRSTHDAYFIAFDVTPYASLEERVETHLRAQDKVIVKSVAKLLQNKGIWGQRFFRDADGEVWKQNAPNAHRRFAINDPDHPIGTQMYAETYLTEEEARAFQIELHQLAAKYFKPYTRKRKEEGRQAHILNYTFVEKVTD